MLEFDEISITLWEVPIHEAHKLYDLQDVCDRGTFDLFLGVRGMADIMNILSIKNLEPRGSLKQFAAEEVARQAKFVSGSKVREAIRFNEAVRQEMIEQRRQELGRWHAEKVRWDELKEFERGLDRANPANLGREGGALRMKSQANLAGLEEPDMGMRSPLASFRFWDETELPHYTDDFIYFVCQRLNISQADDVVSMGLDLTRQHFAELLAMKLDLPTTATNTLLHQLWRDYVRQQPRRSSRLAGHRR